MRFRNFWRCRTLEFLHVFSYFYLVVGHQPTLKKRPSQNLIGYLNDREKNILSDDLIHIFDKKTGEKFFKQSSIQVCQITHYTIKSEKSGKTLLLSGDGIKRRFTQTPYTERKQIKDIFGWLLKFR